MNDDGLRDDYICHCCIHTRVSDVDECSDIEGACHHLCINTDGSYECACNVGYKLLPDRRNCIKGTKYFIYLLIFM